MNVEEEVERLKEEIKRLGQPDGSFNVHKKDSPFLLTLEIESFSDRCRFCGYESDILFWDLDRRVMYRFFHCPVSLFCIFSYPALDLCAPLGEEDEKSWFNSTIILRSENELESGRIISFGTCINKKKRSNNSLCHSGDMLLQETCSNLCSKAKYFNLFPLDGWRVISNHHCLFHSIPSSNVLYSLPFLSPSVYLKKQTKGLLRKKRRMIGFLLLDGAQVTFGTLFNDDRCANIFEALVGTLRAAKKRKVVTYDGELLLQGVHDNVEITLKPTDEPVKN